MAGPTIAVQVLADFKNFTGALNTVGQKAQSTASGMRQAFGGTLNALNQTGVLGPFGVALDGIDQALNEIGKHGQQLGVAMIGVGGALAGVGGGLAALGSKDQAAHQQLQAAVQATGKNYDDYADQVDKAIKHEEKFGDTSAQTQDALAKLTEATGDPAKALSLLGTATDLAAAKHEDLTSAAGQLGKAYNGNAKILKEFGITVTKSSTLSKTAAADTRAEQAAGDNLARAKRSLADIELVDGQRKKLTLGQQIQLRNAQEAVSTATTKYQEAQQKAGGAQKAATAGANSQGQTMTLLAQKLHGQASAAADTFTGKLDALKAHLEDTAATFGQKYGPAITAAGSGMAVLGGAATAGRAALEAARGAAIGTRIELTLLSAWEKITAATTWLLNAALDANPIVLIIIGIGLLIAGIVLLVTHFKVLRDAIKDVWEWIVAHWPLLLAIILGPIGIAIDLVIKNWKRIKDAVLDVINWVRTHWALIVDILLGPIGVAITLIVQHWSDFIGFFTSLPGKIASIAAGMWHGVSDAFKDTINFLIDIWNKLHFTLPKVSFLGVHVGGETIGVPHIPHLAEGGLITQTGLVLAHAGEAITPIDKVPRGPAVHIENANFSTELDVESFSRRVAWVMQTAKL